MRGLKNKAMSRKKNRLGLAGSTGIGSRTLADEVYANLKQAIKSGEMRPGSRLSPAVLASQYNVSSTVVREALTRLTSEQLARSSP